MRVRPVLLRPPAAMQVESVLRLVASLIPAAGWGLPEVPPDIHRHAGTS
jgi:hypothetical protein